MKLISISDDKYEKYRLDEMFVGYKWDPQFLDNNTIAKYVLVLTEEEAREIEELTEKLAAETIAAENMLNKNLMLSKPLELPRQTYRMLKKMGNYQPEKHVRLMRFDFHAIKDGGFAISEVNSDVPGGFAEASIMPAIAADLFKDKSYYHKNFGDILTEEIAKKTKPNGTVAFVHCTSYSDDRQMVQFLGDKLEKLGRKIIYCAGDHIRFEDKMAISVLDGNAREVDVIFRFTPLEWLIGLKKTWHGYFDTVTPSCNHPISIFAQTKRFPLIWDSLEKLGVDLSAWRTLLPETLEVKDAAGKKGFIFKPACGRVGEGIAIKEACSNEEYDKILKDVKKRPKQYISQKMFNSLPIMTEDGDSRHVCLGAYSVEGKAAGFYARVSKTPRIDSSSADIPVLIEGKAKKVKEKDEVKEGLAISNVLRGREAFEIWAPPSSVWSAWVRPVPFAAKESEWAIEYFETPRISYVEKAESDTAIVLDLPDNDAIEEGIVLAGMGYRPIPLYNGTFGQYGAMSLVRNENIVMSLRHGAEELSKIKVPSNAPPAFLLDRNRTLGFKMDVSVFDNSWDIYAQDMPSAEYLQSNGITKIIVRGGKVQRDLNIILYKYQSKGIKIYLANQLENPVPHILKQPKRKHLKMT